MKHSIVKKVDFMSLLALSHYLRYNQSLRHGEEMEHGSSKYDQQTYHENSVNDSRALGPFGATFFFFLLLHKLSADDILTGRVVGFHFG